MTQLPRLLSYSGPSRSQMTWATAGLSVLIMISVVAFSNLQGIYDAQKDFVVGTLFSLAGFCFGKALTRTQEQRALDLISNAPTERVAHALTEELEARLHSDGVFEQLSVLERNVDAAVSRLSEYYDAQARRLEFYRHAPLLRVALDDLDKAAANVVALRRTLMASADQPSFTMAPAMRLGLIRVRRDLREAMGRRDQAYEWFAARLDPAAEEDVWDVFAVMTADMLKGDRMLESLLGQHLPFPVAEYMNTIIDYVAAALGRSDEFERVADDRSIARPTIFAVMVGDLRRARDALVELATALAAPLAAPLEPPLAAPLAAPLVHGSSGVSGANTPLEP